MCARIGSLVIFLICALLSACALQHDGRILRERESFNPYADHFISHKDSIRASLFWYERGRQGEASGGEAGANAPDYYERAFELNPRNTDAMVRRIDMLLAGSSCEAAMISANQALRIDPKNALFWAAKARVHWRRSMPGAQDTTMSCYDLALRLEPKNAALWKEKGERYLMFGWDVRSTQARNELAAQCYARALKLAPEDADLWAKQGYLLRDQSRRKEAAHAYRQAMRRDPKRTPAMYHALVSLFESAHDTNAALAAYREAQNAMPDSAWVWLECGEFLCSLKRYRVGFAHMDKAIAVDPSDTKTRTRKAFALRDAGRPDDAVRAWDIVISMDSISGLNRGWDFYWKAQVLFTAKRYAEAEPILIQSTQTDPSIGWAWYDLAVTWSELKRPVEQQLAALDGSLAHWHSSYRTHPLAMKARTLEEMGRTPEALATLDSVVKLDPKDSQAWRLKAWVFARHESPYEAIVCCDSALVLDPKDDWSQETRAEQMKYLLLRNGLPALDDTLHKSDH